MGWMAEMKMELYLHSPICHCVMLNYFSTGTLPFTIWGAVDLNTKLKEILNGGNLTLRLLT
jgi:hypothetical protein